MKTNLSDQKNENKNKVAKDTPSSVNPPTSKKLNNLEEEPNPDVERKEFEGDEREWQTPDVKPKYPTDVQASRPSPDDPNEYTVEDDDDNLLATENPDLMVRH